MGIWQTRDRRANVISKPKGVRYVIWSGSGRERGEAKEQEEEDEKEEEKEKGKSLFPSCS